MQTAIVILACALILSLAANFVQYSWYMDTKEQLYKAEMWIDPVACIVDDLDIPMDYRNERS